MEIVGPDHKRKLRLWLWFVIGFLLVFIGMSVTVTMYAMHPSGQFVVECSLWEYYLTEFRGAAGPQVLGPGTGGLAAALKTALQHLLISAGGGTVFLGIGWIASRLFTR